MRLGEWLRKTKTEKTKICFSGIFKKKIVSTWSWKKKKISVGVRFKYFNSKRRYRRRKPVAVRVNIEMQSNHNARALTHTHTNTYTSIHAHTSKRRALLERFTRTSTVHLGHRRQQHQSPSAGQFFAVTPYQMA